MRVCVFYLFKTAFGGYSIKSALPIFSIYNFACKIIDMAVPDTAGLINIGFSLYL